MFDIDRPGLLSLITALLLWSNITPVCAETFVLPDNGDKVIGALGLATPRHEDTLSDLARAYDVGFWEIRRANPTVDAWLPGDETEVVVPSQFVLPDAPLQGIVINVPEMRLYYYPNKGSSEEPREVVTYPISVGRQDWSTPHGLTKVIAKKSAPDWHPPESIREEHAAQGDPLPKLVPAGPDNPLGKYALRLGIPGYLIHGTNKPYGIGMRVTHGCIRLYPKDIERLFGDIDVGTAVRIVNQPYKVGSINGVLYLEAHPQLEEDIDMLQEQRAGVGEAVYGYAQERGYGINWDVFRSTIEMANGLPIAIGTRANTPGTASESLAPLGLVQK